MTNPIATSKLTGLDKTYLHFAALWGLALMLMLNWAEGYRTFVYLNLIIVVAYAFSAGKEETFRAHVIAIAVIPLILSVLHMLAAGAFDMIKEVRHIWLAAFTSLSIVILARVKSDQIKAWLPVSIMVLLVIYCIAQIIGLTAFKNPYGLNKNPHYLALYSSLGLPLALYCLLFVKNRLRYLMVPVAVSLGYFVLYTSSRPAWIALLVAAASMLFFVKGRGRLVTLILIFAVPVVLFFTNLAGFGDRLTDLANNITTEERVVIWQDAWRMQDTSSVSQWLIGHGLDSYEEDFRKYSQYHQLVDFHSPHNSFLEILYTSGIVGLMVCIWLYYWIYSRLWRLSKDVSGQRRVAVLLVSIATINFLFIMLTIPFISHYNIYTLAFVIGIIFYHKENSARRPDAA